MNTLIMKTKILIAALIFLVIYGCSKSSSTTKPGLSLKSLNGTSFAAGSTVNFSFNFTVPQGGTVTDTLYILRKYFSCPYKAFDSAYFIVPTFTATSDQKAVMNYSYITQSGGFYNGCVDNFGNTRTDSVYFFFWLKDKNGNKSDTLKSPKITLLK